VAGGVVVVVVVVIMMGVAGVVVVVVAVVVVVVRPPMFFPRGLIPPPSPPPPSLSLHFLQQFYHRMLSDDNITITSFHATGTESDHNLKGSYRPLVSYPCHSKTTAASMEGEEGASTVTAVVVVVEFRLKAGCFATICLRELLHHHPDERGGGPSDDGDADEGEVVVEEEEEREAAAAGGGGGDDDDEEDHVDGKKSRFNK